MSRRSRSARRESGFGLIEVLVAVLVVALGVVAGMGAIAQGLRDSRTALWRTQAATLAADLADRLRANVAAADSYDPTLYALGPATLDCGRALTCTPRQLAEDDLADWLATVRSRLPHRPRVEPPATVTFSRDGVGLRRARVTVQWDDPSQQSPASFSLDVALIGGGSAR